MDTNEILNLLEMVNTVVDTVRRENLCGEEVQPYVIEVQKIVRRLKTHLELSEVERCMIAVYEQRMHGVLLEMYLGYIKQIVAQQVDLLR
jgi:hypothetical protein